MRRISRHRSIPSNIAARWFFQRSSPSLSAFAVTTTALISRPAMSSLRDPNKPWEKYDTVAGHVADEELFGDKDIFEDPSSKLFNDEVEEMSEEELWDFMQRLSGSYNEHMYCYLTIPVVDLTHIMLQERLIPRVRSETTVCSWFGDANLVLRKPSIAIEWMGKERWDLFCDGASVLMNDISVVSPLKRVCERHSLPTDIWIPFMRQLSLEHMSAAMTPGRHRAREQLASFFVAVANGRGPPSLGMPTDEKARVVLIANLMISTAQESGNKDIAFAGLHLQHAHHVSLSYAQQRALMNVFANTAKRTLDWDLRSSGQLKRSISDWLTKYFPSILNDVSATTEVEDAENSKEIGVSRGEEIIEELPGSSVDVSEEDVSHQIHSVSNIHRYFTHDHEIERDRVGREKRTESIVAVAQKLNETKDAKDDIVHARTLVNASLNFSEDEKLAAAPLEDANIKRPKSKKSSPSPNRKLADAAARKLGETRTGTKRGAATSAKRKKKQSS